MDCETSCASYGAASRGVFPACYTLRDSACEEGSLRLNRPIGLDVAPSLAGAVSMLFLVVSILGHHFNVVSWIALAVLLVSVALAKKRQAPIIAGLLLIASRAGVGLAFFPSVELVIVLVLSVTGAYLLLRYWTNDHGTIDDINLSDRQ